MNLQEVEHIRQVVSKLVPASELSAVECFVFYDNHPRDEKNIDITICTNNSLVEYYKREVVSSIVLNAKSKITDIRILRNANCELYYLVVAVDEIILLSRKETLQIHRRIKNVERFEIEDLSCSGQPCLKIFCKEDAVPMVFDENFEHLGDKAMCYNGIHADDSLPILTQLMRKLTASKYSVKCNQKTLKEFLSLRQATGLSAYKEVNPNSKDSLFKNSEEGADVEVLDFKTLEPWVKLCNKRIVIMLRFSYESSVPLEDIEILLHGTSKNAIVYTTRLYQKIPSAPFWKEKSNCLVKNEQEAALTAVINLSELNNAVTNKIEFNGAVFYKKSGKELLCPFDPVFISGEEILSIQYDALMCSDLDEITCLAIMASTTKTDMVFRHIRKEEEPEKEMSDLFRAHLQMELIQNENSVLIYRHSPYHALNGVMLVLEKNLSKPDIYNVLVYTRTESQISTLMFYVHQTIPCQILITMKHQNISATNESLSRYNEELVSQPLNVNYERYGASIVKQCDSILEHLDNCMIKMSESKEDLVKARIGTEVDLFAHGVEKYNEFKNKLLQESLKGIKSFSECNSSQEKMIIE